MVGTVFPAVSVTTALTEADLKLQKSAIRWSEGPALRLFANLPGQSPEGCPSMEKPEYPPHLEGALEEL